jgi:hypothetical protein
MSQLRKAHFLEVLSTLQIVDRFTTPENLRKLRSWAENPNCYPLTLTALRVLSLNEITVIEDDLQRSLAATEENKDEGAESAETIARFLLWASIPLEFSDLVNTEVQHVSSCETSHSNVQESERTLHSAPLPTQSNTESRNQNSANGTELQTHESADGEEKASFHETNATGVASSPLESKRAWTAVQNGVRGGSFFTAAAAVLKREVLAQEQERHIAKVQEWLSEPLSQLELAPRPWTIMRLMGSGCVECVSNEPHSMVLRPGSEALSEILVAGSRSEMMGALQRVQKADQRELQRLALAEQVGPVCDALLL